MTKNNPQVDGFIRKNARWEKELQKLRSIILETELVEEVKWRVPCYTLEGANVVFLGGFKDNCVLSFVKGVLLKDPHKILIQQTENSQSVRIIRFPNVAAITKVQAIVKAYVNEAIAVEKAGVKVPLKKITEHKVPEELQTKLDSDPAFKKAFQALTPGRQRGYMLYFAGAKQAATRAARVEKCTPQILAGKGLDD
jgi:uncharacterized protein YdeI (YjbR/CyaY-like superfamily)